MISCSNPDEVFANLIETLALSNRTWEYYVNWEKVLGKLRGIEVDLNTMNYLIGKDNIEEEFTY